MHERARAKLEIEKACYAMHRREHEERVARRERKTGRAQERDVAGPSAPQPANDQLQARSVVVAEPDSDRNANAPPVHARESETVAPDKALRQGQKGIARLEKRLAGLTLGVTEQQERCRELAKKKIDAEKRLVDLRDEVVTLELDLKTIRQEEMRLASQRRLLSKKVEWAKAEIEKMANEIATKRELQAQLEARMKGMQKQYDDVQRIKESLSQLMRDERVAPEVRRRAKELYDFIERSERGG